MMIDQCMTQCPLGDLDADSYDEKKNLLENFIKTADYQKIFIPKIIFLSGRKGVGKTAIAYRSESELDSHGQKKYDFHLVLRKWEFYRSFIFDLRESYKSFVADYDTTQPEKIDLELYFENFWQYVTHICAMKAVVDDSPQSEVSDIYNYLKNNNYLQPTNKGFIDKFQEILHNDYSILRNNVNSGEPVAGILLKSATDRLIERSFVQAQTALRYYLNNNNKKILIVVDTIEKYYAFESLFRKPIQGMMQGIYEFRHEEENQNIHIKCFIPHELYGNFASWNRNKTYGSNISLSWNYRELLHFMCKRLIFYIDRNYSDEILKTKIRKKWDSVDSSKKQDLREFWNVFFPEEITDHFGVNEDCFNYILRHTHNKPRHFLLLGNQIINTAEKRGHTPCKITPKDVDEGIHYDLSELINDIVKPFVDEKTEEYIDLLEESFTGQPTIFSGTDIKTIIKKGRQNLKKMGLSPEISEKILLKSGLIGQVVSKETLQIGNSHELTIFKTKFDYLYNTSQLSQINKNCTYAFHSIMTDFLQNKVTRDDKICIYPFSGENYDREPDGLFIPINDE